MSEESKQTFLRYDTGKFSTHASVPGIILETVKSIQNYRNFSYYSEISLKDIIEKFHSFKANPTKLELNNLIYTYAIYINSMNKEKLQSLENEYTVISLSTTELFGILYEYHTRVSTEGAKKYKLNNWLNSQPEDILRCLEPCERHMIYYPLVKKEIVDSENGLPHYMPTIWNLIAIHRLFQIDDEICKKKILGVKD